MNTKNTGLGVAAFIFGLIGVGHIWRLVAHFEVRIGQFDVPIWASVVALVIAGGLSVWLWTLSAKR